MYCRFRFTRARGSPKWPSRAGARTGADCAHRTGLRGNLGTRGTVVAGAGNMINRLANRPAIVTGAAGGVGTATARLFVAEGANVVLTDVLAPGRGARARTGQSALFQPHDVASEADWQRVLAATLARYGGVDVLVNNAGILMMRGLPGHTSKQDFERVLGINLVGTFLGIKTVAPKMIERGTGSITIV